MGLCRTNETIIHFKVEWLGCSEEDNSPGNEEWRICT